ncbi:hypothetical protein HNP52_002348 [Sphingomonas kyeonggiensis]|uniref:Transferrin-binding protein B C-lobe/N-lobe beta barrel domain-containing protein n=1 Tax=Sphingomonas kyeonggiensis TaxID=1268553 RepID=A0A7W7K1H1_9SPHN|nr:hypothetical protein [Sphingomonas kyeonggiensis]MBB4839279.1 hypothetical protein [Sphingomonas kyeonggiensis]
MRAIFVGAVCAVLAACNSGGGTPAPSPTPTATPSPTPTPATLLTLTSDQVFATASARVMNPYGPDFTYVPSSSLDSYGNTITFNYGVTGNYAINGDDTNPPAFPASSLVAGSDPVFASYNVSPTGDSNLLTLFRPGSANTRLALSYASYGILDDMRFFSSHYNRHYYRSFAYGLAAPLSGVPSTGNLAFASSVDGYWARLRTIDPINGYIALRLSGPVTMSVDYAARTVSLSMQLSGTDNNAGGLGTVALGTVQGTGNFSATSNTISGTLTGAGFTGSFSGSLFGPQATELGLAFRVTSTSPSQQDVAGVVVGKR